MILNVEECQLVLLDFPKMNTQDALAMQPSAAVAQSLGQIAKLMNVPVWGAQQSLDGGHSMQDSLRALCQKVIPKLHFDACEEGLIELLKASAKPVAQGNARSLPKHLQKQNAVPQKNTVLLCGWQTHISVLQTALGLVDAEFDVCLVTDGCGCMNSKQHDAALDRLAGAGVELLTLEMVVFEWLSAADHPSFQDVMALLHQN
jgi:nicotinamidase-related amidase